MNYNFPGNLYYCMQHTWLIHLLLLRKLISNILAPSVIISSIYNLFTNKKR